MTFNLEHVSVLGHEEAAILKAIEQGLCDIQSIHVVTGIPDRCIEIKIAALVALGLVAGIDGSFKVVDA